MARLSEKTIEINFCAQLTVLANRLVWWIGLTQAQEAEQGWDIKSNALGRWMLFQLQASNKIMSGSQRRFTTKHHQYVALKKQVTTPYEVFYVLPMIGTTEEATAAGYALAPNLRFLDLHDIPALGPPTRDKTTELRQNEMHYIDLAPDSGLVTIHSEPVIVPTLDLAALLGQIRTPLPRPAGEDEQLRGVDRARRFIAGGRSRVAAFIPQTT